MIGYSCLIAFIDFTGFKDSADKNKELLSIVEENLIGKNHAIIAYNSNLGSNNEWTMSQFADPFILAESNANVDHLSVYISCPHNHWQNVLPVPSLDWKTCYMKGRTFTVGSLGPANKVLIPMKLIEAIGLNSPLDYKV